MSQIGLLGIEAKDWEHLGWEALKMAIPVLNIANVFEGCDDLFFNEQADKLAAISQIGFGLVGTIPIVAAELRAFNFLANLGQKSISTIRLGNELTLLEKINKGLGYFQSTADFIAVPGMITGAYSAVTGAYDWSNQTSEKRAEILLTGAFTLFPLALTRYHSSQAAKQAEAHFLKNNQIDLHSTIYEQMGPLAPEKLSAFKSVTGFRKEITNNKITISFNTKPSVAPQVYGGKKLWKKLEGLEVLSVYGTPVKHAMREAYQTGNVKNLFFLEEQYCVHTLGNAGFTGIEINGIHNIPDEKIMIACGTHPHAGDIATLPLIISSMGKDPHPVVKKTLIKKWVPIFADMAQEEGGFHFIPAIQNDGGQTTLTKIKQSLHNSKSQDQALLVMTSGTRTAKGNNPNQNIYKPKIGAFLQSIELDLPLVPLFHHYGDDGIIRVFAYPAMHPKDFPGSTAYERAQAMRTAYETLIRDEVIKNHQNLFGAYIPEYYRNSEHTSAFSGA